MADLDVWVNAFIPLSVPGYTVVIPGGSMRGSTAVPLPWQARGSPACWNKPWYTGYVGDQRGFSDDPTASVRMHMMAQLSSDGTNWTMKPELKSTTTGTTEINLKTGRIQHHAKAHMDDCHFSKEGMGTFKDQWQILGGQSAVVSVSDNDQSALRFIWTRRLAIRLCFRRRLYGIRADFT